MAPRAKNRTAEAANFTLVMAFSGFCLTPLLVFWTTAAGWVRAPGAATPAVAPSWPAFLAGLALCFVYPILLQRYNRARVERLQRRRHVPAGSPSLRRPSAARP